MQGLQVNHSPSFTVDTPLDLAIKEELISDTIELVRARCNPGNSPETPPGGPCYLACLPLHAVMLLLCVAAGGHRPQGDKKAQGGGADGCTRAAVRRRQGGPCTGAWRCVTSHLLSLVGFELGGELGWGSRKPITKTLPRVTPSHALHAPQAKSDTERAAAAAKVMRKREKYEAEHLGGYALPSVGTALFNRRPIAAAFGGARASGVQKTPLCGLAASHSRPSCCATRPCSAMGRLALSLRLVTRRGDEETRSVGWMYAVRYKRIYPPMDQPELQARYLHMLEGAAHLFRGAQPNPPISSAGKRAREVSSKTWRPISVLGEGRAEHRHGAASRDEAHRREERDARSATRRPQAQRTVHRAAAVVGGCVAAAQARRRAGALLHSSTCDSFGSRAGSSESSLELSGCAYMQAARRRLDGLAAAAERRSKGDAAAAATRGGGAARLKGEVEGEDAGRGDTGRGDTGATSSSSSRVDQLRCEHPPRGTGALTGRRHAPFFVVARTQVVASHKQTRRCEHWRSSSPRTYVVHRFGARHAGGVDHY